MEAKPLNKAHAECHQIASTMRKYHFCEALESHQRAILHLKEAFISVTNRKMKEIIEYQIKDHQRQMGLLVLRNQQKAKEVEKMKKRNIVAHIRESFPMLDMSGDCDCPEDESHDVDDTSARLVKNHGQLIELLEKASNVTKSVIKEEELFQDKPENENKVEDNVGNIKVMVRNEKKTEVNNSIKCLLENAMEIGVQNAKMIRRLIDENGALKAKMVEIKYKAATGGSKENSEKPFDFQINSMSDTTGELAPLEMPSLDFMNIHENTLQS